ncbi:hypothetical protein LWI29_029344 [Acer saccharum]|uniref:Neprosin PEP catalytic domain-containing protein n=1 Tax=Acer saccharum TaxID=4024 RepID=A0AA39RE03_ACESA|nr:hypothetical protein LWI29_029344 [Acer saccharum]
MNQSAILITVGYNYFGAQGDINLWNPAVDLPDDYTTAQIWLKAGPADNFERVEARWVSEDGDIIDCVGIHKQPAFDHPALRNHKIQMRPSFDLPTEKLDTRNESSQSKPVIQQTWQKSGSCPEGTVPIRRIRKQDLLRAASLEQFGTKPANIPSAASNKTDTINIISPPSINNTKLNFLSPINRSSAILITEGYNYFGAGGDINIWNPTVDLPDDYTTGQIWLKAGPVGNFESIEAGWMDTKKRNWWLKCGQNYDVVVGYWPKELFGYMSYSAKRVERGGEVYSTNVKKKPHTKTQMGSGSDALTLETSAAYIKHVRIMDYSRQLKYPDWVLVGSDEENCYNAVNYFHRGRMHEPVFFFGGPGKGLRCP